MKHLLIPAMMFSSLLLTGCGAPDNSTIGCFNPALYQAGNTLTYVNYRDNASYDMIEMSYQPLTDATQVEELGVFKDLQGKTQQQYFKTLTVDQAQQQLLRHNERFVMDKVEFQLQYSPARPEVFNAGLPTDTPASATYEMRSHMTSDPSGSATHTEEHIVTKFIGHEQLSTPAGTFSTCHFSDTIQRHDVANDKTSVITSHRWYDDKLGIQVQVANEQQTRKRVLVKAHVNGETFSAPAELLNELHIEPISNRDGGRG